MMMMMMMMMTMMRSRGDAPRGECLEAEGVCEEVHEEEAGQPAHPVCNHSAPAVRLLRR